MYSNIEPARGEGKHKNTIFSGKGIEVMKYIVVQESRGDEFDNEFDTLQEAIEAADYEYHHMTELEKKKCKYFYILESANPDPDAADHFDGNPVKEYM